MSEIIDQKAKELAFESEKMLVLVQALVVTTPDQYLSAALALKHIKAKAKEVDGQRVFLKAPALEQAKRVEDFFRAPLKYLSDAESLLKRCMLNYQQAEEAKRHEAERKLQEAARREQERLRIDAEDKERKAAELRRLAEQATTQEEAAKINAKAAKIEIKAEEKTAQADMVIMPTLARDQPKVAGISVRKSWKHRVTDSRKVPREYLIVNEKMLADFAKATKGQIAVDGVEFYVEEIMAAG